MEIVDKYKRLILCCMALAFIPMYNYTMQGKAAINAAWCGVGVVRGIVYRLELHNVRRWYRFGAWIWKQKTPPEYRMAGSKNKTPGKIRGRVLLFCEPVADGLPVLDKCACIVQIP